MTPSHRKFVTLLSDTADGQPTPVDGGLLWMARPEIASKAYRHRIYDGLDEVGLQDVVQRYGCRANRPALAWLRAANGARLFDGMVVLKGLVSSQRRDPADALGQPISLDYGNIIGVPSFADPDQFVAGTFILDDDILPIIIDSGGQTVVFNDGVEMSRWRSIWDFVAGLSDWLAAHQAIKLRH